MGMLTNEQLLKLDKVLIRDNVEVTGVLLESAYKGKGNSNTSSYTVTDRDIKTLEELKDTDIYGYKNDIAYDTLGFMYIVPLPEKDQ